MFLWARKAIGIPAEHPFERTCGYRPNGTTIESEPNDYPARLRVHVDAGEALMPHADEAHNWPEGTLVLVQLDSAGADTRAEHNRIVARLGESLAIAGIYEWYAFDEDHDAWHFRTTPYGGGR